MDSDMRAWCDRCGKTFTVVHIHTVKPDDARLYPCDVQVNLPLKNTKIQMDLCKTCLDVFDEEWTKVIQKHITDFVKNQKTLSYK